MKVSWVGRALQATGAAWTKAGKSRVLPCDSEFRTGGVCGVLISLAVNEAGGERGGWRPDRGGHGALGVGVWVFF